MERMSLGQGGVEVSGWCLGTMTYGNQTPEADAHPQIDMALEAGIDFLDTAEMYPVNPVLAETAGWSEEIVGRWIARAGLMPGSHPGRRRAAQSRDPAPGENRDEDPGLPRCGPAVIS